MNYILTCSYILLTRTACLHWFYKVRKSTSVADETSHRRLDFRLAQTTRSSWVERRVWTWSDWRTFEEDKVVNMQGILVNIQTRYKHILDEKMHLENMMRQTLSKFPNNVEIQNWSKKVAKMFGNYTKGEWNKCRRSRKINLVLCGVIMFTTRCRLSTTVIHDLRRVMF